MGEETKSFDFKESFFFFSLFLGLLFLWVVSVSLDSRRSSPISLLTWIEPQALLASLVSLALTRAVFEVFSSLFGSFSRWKASPSAQPPSTRSIQCSPSLSAMQHENLRKTNARFAHVFTDLHQAPTLTRRVSPLAPFRNPAVTNRALSSKSSFSGLRRENLRDLPRPPWKKLAARSRSRTNRHPPARRLPPKAKRVISMTKAPHYSPGPKGWVAAQPTSQPGSPLRDVSHHPSAAQQRHIFASVPDMDFSLRRDTFGQQTTVVEKLRLLSQPRSSFSSKALSTKPKRCFVIQIVRGEMAAAQARSDSRQRQSQLHESSSAESLRPRAQWMLDTPPYATKEEADRTYLASRHTHSLWRCAPFKSLLIHWREYLEGVS
jgi:hypothetical protein